MLRVLPLILLLLLIGCARDDGENNQVVQGSNLILNIEHGDAGAAWGLPECSACHPLGQIHVNTDETTRSMTLDKGYSSCSGCHGSNGSSIIRQCLICHNSSDLPVSPHLDGIVSHNFKSGATGGMSDENCLVCHVGSDMDGVFELDQDLTAIPDTRELYSPYNSEADFCLRCHNRDHQQPGYEIETTFYDPLIAIEESYKYIDQHGEVDGSGMRTYAGLRSQYSYPSEVKCSDCHAMHGTNNQGLIIDSSAKGVSKLDLTQPDVAAHPYSIMTNSGEYSQLCAMCHQMAVILDDGAMDTGNGLAGVHQVGGDCSVCHSHGEAVQAGL